MKKLLLLICVLLLISCSETPKQEFSLSGVANAAKNNTYLYLAIDDTIDSTLVINNRFNFTTKLPKSPVQAVLRDKNYTNYRFLWLENNPMTFDDTDSKFRYAKVTGSESETLSYNLSVAIDSLSRNEQLKKEMEFVETHPNSIVSANILSVYKTTLGKDETSKLYSKLTDRLKNTEYGKEIKNYLELAVEPKIGDSFVDFEMDDTNNESQKLSSLKGKTVLLEFWASWCGPCREENPNLVKTYQKYNSKGFEVFAVSLDQNKDQWLKAIDKDSLEWLHVSDLKADENLASLIYGISGIPDNFLIDPNGVIIGRNLRGDQLTSELSKILD